MNKKLNITVMIKTAYIVLLATLAQGPVRAVNPVNYTSPVWQPGQWVEYSVVENNVIPSGGYQVNGIGDNRFIENSTIRISIVGTEIVNDKTYYWYEFKQVKPGYYNTPNPPEGQWHGSIPPSWVAKTRTVIVKLLVDGPEFKDIRRYQVKIDDEPAREFTDGWLAALPEEIKELLGKRPIKADLMLSDFSGSYMSAINGNNWVGQSFKAKSAKINGVSLDLKRVAGQNYDLVVELYDDNGGLPGKSLAKEVVPYTEVSTSGGMVDVMFEYPVPSRPGATYHVVAHTPTMDPGTTFVYQIKTTGTSSTYPDGSGELSYRGVTWTAYPTLDFKIAVLREIDQLIEEDIINDAICNSMSNAIGGATWAAQSFKIRRALNIYGVALDLKRLQNYDLVVEIRADSNGLPGNVLRSKVVPYPLIPTTGKFVRVDFEEPLKVTPGSRYHLTAHTLGNQGTAGASYQWRLTDPYLSKYPDGGKEASVDGGTGWTKEPGGPDFTFVIMENDPTEAGWSLIKPMCHSSDVAHNDRWGIYNNAVGGTAWAAQEFSPNVSNITAVTLDLKRLEDIDLVVELYNDNAGLPGSSLAGKTVPYNKISRQGGYVTVFFDTPIAVAAGSTYHLVLHTASGQGTDGGSYGWRLGHDVYSTYFYGEIETGTSGVFSTNDANGRDYYVITHYLDAEAQEVITTAGTTFNTDRVVSNRLAVTSRLSNLVPVTGIVKRENGEGIGIQWMDDSLDIKMDEVTGQHYDSVIGGASRCAQEVRVNTTQISGISFDLKRIEDYDLVVELMGDSSGLPDDSVLASTTIHFSRISTSGGWVDAYFDHPVIVTCGSPYHLVLRTADNQGSPGGAYQIRLANPYSSVYAYGQKETSNGSSWINDGSGRDYAFKLHYARNDRFHNSYQSLLLSGYGQTGAVSEITDVVKLSMKSAVPNSDGNVVNSTALLGGYKQDDWDIAVRQEWWDAGANYSPSLMTYDEGIAERELADSKPYYYASGRPWQQDLFDKWRPGMKGISWHDEPYARQIEEMDGFSLKDATSESDAARKYREHVKWTRVNKLKYWGSEIVPSYDVEYGLGHNMETGADVAMHEEWYNGPPSDFLDGISFNQTSEVARINNAGLRGFARNFGKVWGKGAYPGLMMNNWATGALTLAFDEGADYLLYWADNPTNYAQAKTSCAAVRAYINSRRQTEVLPDTVLLLPRNFGYYGYGDNRYSWGIGWSPTPMSWEEYHWKDVMQDFYAKAKELLNAGIQFDIAYDGYFKSYLYKNIYRFNGTEGNWWDSNWHWRLPVSFGKNASTLAAGTVVQVSIDFEDKLRQKGVVNPDLDENSIRVLSYNRSTNTFTLIPSSDTQFNDAAYNGAPDEVGNGRGDVKFRLESDLAANTSRIYYIYFDITSYGSKPAWGSTLGAAAVTKMNNIRLPIFVDHNQYESGFTGNGIDPPIPPSTAGILTGQVTIEGVTGDNHLTPIGIEIMQDGVVIRQERVFLDANNNYTLSGLDPGTYDITFSAAKSLRKTVTGVVVSDNGIGSCSVSLESGDLDGDGVVGDSDIDILRRNWGKDGD